MTEISRRKPTPKNTDWVVLYDGSHPDETLRNKVHCQHCGESALAPYGATIPTFVAMTETFRKLHDKCPKRQP